MAFLVELQRDRPETLEESTQFYVLLWAAISGRAQP